MTVVTERPNWSATDKQRWRLLNKSVVQFMVPVPTIEQVIGLCAQDDFLKSDASALIDTFEKLPARPRADQAAVQILINGDPATATPPATTSTAFRGADWGNIEALPVTFFAVPVSELPTDVAALAGNSDFLFGEVRKWNGHKFMNVLKGSAPTYSRERVKGAPRGAIIHVIEKDILKYVMLFDTEGKNCTCCGAELTDNVSRAMHLGPTCRLKFGL